MKNLFYLEKVKLKYLRIFQSEIKHIKLCQKTINSKQVQYLFLI